MKTLIFVLSLALVGCGNQVALPGGDTQGDTGDSMVGSNNPITSTTTTINGSNRCVNHCSPAVDEDGNIIVDEGGNTVFSVVQDCTDNGMQGPQFFSGLPQICVTGESGGEEEAQVEEESESSRSVASEESTVIEIPSEA